MTGRPGTVMEEAREKVLQYISRGMTRRAACAMVGIHENTIRRWELDEEDSEFGERLRLAGLLAQAHWEESIHTAAHDDWRAAAWLLERRDPENWSKRQRIEHSGRVDHAHYIERTREALETFTPEQIVAFVEGQSRELTDGQ